MRQGLCGLVLGAILLCAGRVDANGRFPATTSTALEPAPGDRIFVGATFGLLVTSDGGASWRWICEPSIFVDTAPGTFDPRYLVSPTGTIFAPLPAGLSISRDGGCTFDLIGAPLASMWVDDIAVSPVDPQTVYAVTSTNGQGNGLFISHDDGRTFAIVGAPDSIAFFRRVVVSGADAYVSGYDTSGSGHQRLFVYTGSDQQLREVTPTGLEGAGTILEYMAASQSTPGLVYLKAKVAGPMDALFRSEDGGQSFTSILESLYIRAVVLDGDDTLWVAPNRGVLVSTNRGDSFETKEAVLPLPCLGKRGGELFACAAPGSDWEYGRSMDGLSWESRLLFRANLVGTHDCPSGTPTHDLCEPMWPSLAAQLGIPPDGGVASDAGEVGGSIDAAASDVQGGTGAASESGGGCGCELAGEGRARRAVPWLGLCLGAIVMRRLRRRS